MLAYMHACHMASSTVVRELVKLLGCYVMSVCTALRASGLNKFSGTVQNVWVRVLSAWQTWATPSIEHSLTHSVARAGRRLQCASLPGLASSHTRYLHHRQGTSTEVRCACSQKSSVDKATAA